MAIRFGDAFKSFQEGQQFKQQKQANSIDALIKQAQLKELGYDINHGQGRFGQPSLVQRPDYVSTKYLEREKTGLELKKLQQELDLRKKGLERFGGGVQSGGNLVPKDYDEFGVPKSYYNPEGEIGQKRKEEEIKAEFKLKEPLSREAAVGLQGAEQSMSQIQNIREVANPSNFGNLKSGVGKIRMATNFGVNRPGSIKGAITNFATMGIAKNLLRTTDQQKRFELAVNLIAENNVRAKSGATVPDPEQVREEARQLISDDSFTSFLERMIVSEDYAKGMGEKIRPGSMAKFGQQSQEFNSPAEADASGLPPGTKVTVQGRPYQI